MGFVFFLSFSCLFLVFFLSSFVVLVFLREEERALYQGGNDGLTVDVSSRGEEFRLPSEEVWTDRQSTARCKLRLRLRLRPRLLLFSSLLFSSLLFSSHFRMRA